MRRPAAHLAGFVVAAALCLAGASAHAQDFKGKTIDIVVGNAPGGGYDTFARVIARHMPAHIPGAPTIVVKNMPGAGSAKAAAYVFTQAPKDGTVIGAFTSGAIIEPLLGAQAHYAFAPKQFLYLGTADNGTRTCMTFHTSKTRSFEDARDRVTVMGASQSGGSTLDYARLSNALAGTKFKIVAGYPGTSDILLAMERGEVDGLCGFDYNSLLPQRPDWARENKINILYQIALEPEAKMTRMGVPQFWKHVNNPDDRRAAELIATQQVFGRPYVVPPGTPAPVVRVLRDAFMATLDDPAFRADAERSRINIDPLDGGKVQAIVEKVYAAPAADIARAKYAISTAAAP